MDMNRACASASTVTLRRRRPADAVLSVIGGGFATGSLHSLQCGGGPVSQFRSRGARRLRLASRRGAVAPRNSRTRTPQGCGPPPTAPGFALMNNPAGNTLIPRAKLFGNPTRTSCQISPDGRWLSWLAPRDGVLNIWVAPAGDMRAARVVTAD